MENRRRDRWYEALSAEVYTGSEVIPADAENMGHDGVCLNVDTGLPAGTLVGISMFRVDDGIEDPDLEPVNIPARVVWCTDPDSDAQIQVGMRFVDPQNL